jgi:Inorganic pyrophosphatase
MRLRLFVVAFCRYDECVMVHPWHDISVGDHVPVEFYSVIEIALDSNVKYEVDKTSGFLRIDRVLYSAVYYPANYGFIPRTRGNQGGRNRMPGKIGFRLYARWPLPDAALVGRFAGSSSPSNGAGN